MVSYGLWLILNAIVIGLPHCSRSLHSWTFRMLSTTGWWIISPITHTARSTEARLPRGVRSRPALYLAQRLARCRMPSTLQIWGRWLLETSSVSMLMILMSSFRLPTSNLDARARPHTTLANANKLTLNRQKLKEIIRNSADVASELSTPSGVCLASS